MGTPAFERLLDEKTGTRRTHASRIGVHVGGEEELGALLRNIHTARRSIEIETLHFEPDRVGEQVGEALIAAARSGKQVTVKVDAHYFRRLGDLGDRMKAAGVKLEKTNGRFGWFGIGGHNPLERNHRKVYRFDGERSLVGGFNITEHNYEWQDALVELEGPAGRLEEADPAATDPTLRKNVRVLTTDPRGGDTDSIRDAYLLAIRGARRSIKLQHAYLTDPKVIDALVDARARGVEVQVTLPGKNAEKLPEAAAEIHYDRLIDAGVDLREYRGMTHAKAMSVDGRYAIVGSANLMTALRRTQNELVVALTDKKAVGELDAKLFDATAGDSVALTKSNVDDHRGFAPFSWGAAALDAFLGYGLFGLRLPRRNQE